MEDVNVSGHISSQTNIEGGNYNPIKVEITNPTPPSPSPPYLAPIIGTYHFETRGGFLILKDLVNHKPFYVLGADYVKGLIISLSSSIDIILKDPKNDVSHSFMLNEEMGVTVEGFLTVLEALGEGATASTPINQAIEEEYA